MFFLYLCTYRMLCPLCDRPCLSKQQSQQLFLCHLVLEYFHKVFFADIIVAQRLELWQIKKIGIVFHSMTKKNNITKRLVRIDSFQSTARLYKKKRFLKPVGISLIISTILKMRDNRAMCLVSRSRHPYRDENAILTNMAPASLGDGGLIQLKGQ